MPERILVVDDEAVNREFQEAILIDAGYELLSLRTARAPWPRSRPTPPI